MCSQGYQPLGQLVAALQHFQAEVEPLKQAVRSSRWMCALRIPCQNSDRLMCLTPCWTPHIASCLVMSP